MTEVLPPVNNFGHRSSSSASAIQTSFSSGSLLPHPFPPPQNPGSSNFLSVDFGNPLRRARSDGGAGPRLTHRHSRSDDLRPTILGPPAHSFPPSRHVDFLAAQQGQFLHPSETVSAIRSHHRRTSSGGSRERPWGSPRISPYPSPSQSPARHNEALPSVSAGRGHHHVVSDVSDGYDSGAGYGSDSRSIVVKPNVTTTATADASMKRRINDAKFECPVPGCHSTFTRHFNLKGHMRSHNDEKPFQCKWPGCGKGFARQHDCKRHEQLHSNHRPFTCEGCKKPFARLDALNRHLRSEGGSGCIKANEGVEGGQIPFDVAPMKMEAEGPAGGAGRWEDFGAGLRI